MTLLYLFEQARRLSIIDINNNSNPTSIIPSHLGNITLPDLSDFPTWLVTSVVQIGLYHASAFVAATYVVDPALCSLRFSGPNSSTVTAEDVFLTTGLACKISPQQQAKMDGIRRDRYYFGLDRRLRELIARSSTEPWRYETFSLHKADVDKWPRKSLGPIGNHKS